MAGALAVLAAGPRGPARPSAASDDPKIVVEAKRLHMIAPGLAARGYGKRVEVRARLEGDPEEPEEYYCLDEIWDWGDGTESVHEPDCDPFEPETELKRDFFDEHHFGRGRWRVSFALMHMDEIVVHGSTEIRVY